MMALFDYLGAVAVMVAWFVYLSVVVLCNFGGMVRFIGEYCDYALGFNCGSGSVD